MKYYVMLILFAAAGAFAIFMKRPDMRELVDVKTITGTYVMEKRHRGIPDSKVNGVTLYTSGGLFGNWGNMDIRGVTGHVITVKYVVTPALFGSTNVVTEATGMDRKILYSKDVQDIQSQWLGSSLLGLSFITLFFAFVIFRESRGFK
ncbi:MAG: hypothetical protein AABZ19_12460 [Pseudomonadota bacterium]